MDINPDGLKDYFVYLGRKELIKIAKNNLEERFNEDPSMLMEDYRIEKKQINTHFTMKKSYILRGDNWEINNKGHLRIKLRGRKEYDTYDYGVFKTKKENPVKFRFGAHHSGIFKFGVEIENFSIMSRTNVLNGESEVFFNFKLNL